MKFKPIMILFNDSGESGAGNGGTGSEVVTLSQNEHNAMIKKIDRLEKESARQKQLEEENSKKLGDLKTELNSIITERDGLKSNFETLQSNVKRTYLDQLSDEHKSIASQLPTVESLAEYVKLNAKQPPAGTDSGKAGSGFRDYSQVKWDDMNYDEKEDLRKKRPEAWKKVYKEKFGRNP